MSRSSHSRLNRYAPGGSILSLLPNPLTRVDLASTVPPPDPSRTAPSPGRDRDRSGGRGPRTHVKS